MTASAPPAAVLFDLDGTLVDSLPDMHSAFNRFLGALGRPPVTPGDLRGWVGDGAAELVRRGLTFTGGMPDRPLSQLVAEYIEHYRGHAACETRPYPQVVETLRALYEAGHPLAVCTNKPHALAVEVLRGLGLLDLFRVVLGGDSVPAKKPDPGHLTAALRAMDLPDQRAVMVGDSANDVKSAHAAGLPVVAVSFGYARVDPRDLGADVVIDHFGQLPAAAAAWL